MADIEIQLVTGNAADTLRNDVRERLVAFNATYAGASEHQVFAIAARDASGGTVGGITGSTAWQWLHVDLLWVDASERGKGTGRRLLNAAEELARQRGCRYACLDTFDFQARPFYERQGYAVFAEQEDYPPGHRRFYMRKSLS